MIISSNWDSLNKMSHFMIQAQKNNKSIMKDLVQKTFLNFQFECKQVQRWFNIREKYMGFWMFLVTLAVYRLSLNHSLFSLSPLLQNMLFLQMLCPNYLLQNRVINLYSNQKNLTLKSRRRLTASSQNYQITNKPSTLIFLESG